MFSQRRYGRKSSLSQVGKDAKVGFRIKVTTEATEITASRDFIRLAANFPNVNCCLLT
jgi:hypothetical protein